MEKKIIFIHRRLNGHPLHRKFMNKIGARVFEYNNQGSIPKADIYIFEGSYILPYIYKKLRMINKEAIIITLFSDPRLCYLSNKKRFNQKKEEMVKYSFLRAFFAKKLIKKIDGAICTSELTANFFREFNKNSPLVITPGFVFKETEKRLKKARPDLESKNLLFIGHGPDYYVKGIDIMIESFKEVKKKIPEAKLFILGRWKIRKEWVTEGVHFEGEQDIVKYINKSSLSLHLGRGESFGINIAETLLTGLPTLVSTLTGGKDILKKIDEDLISPLNKSIISKRIEDYLTSSLKKKKSLSKKASKIGKEYNEKEMLENFSSEFEKLLRAIKKN